ncbi:MAG TPA: type II toxin-antitoxin system VapC family toxin [Thermodesulfobacteriota bacterium]|nr:type II toxin-antitoxin system VapC family toxin [Thermodesulfobacteriota bacterium]
MKMSHLIDTDWVIHYLHGNEEIVKRLTSLRESGLAISIISLAELYEGIYYSTDPAGNENALQGFLTGVSILGIDDEICRIFGRERGKLRQQKKTVSDFDLLIASTCLNYDLTLLTNNRKHFEMVEGLNILSL